MLVADGCGYGSRWAATPTYLARGAWLPTRGSLERPQQNPALCGSLRFHRLSAMTELPIERNPAGEVIERAIVHGISVPFEHCDQLLLQRLAGCRPRQHGECVDSEHGQSTSNETPTEARGNGASVRVGRAEPPQDYRSRYACAESDVDLVVRWDLWLSADVCAHQRPARRAPQNTRKNIIAIPAAFAAIAAAPSRRRTPRTAATRPAPPAAPSAPANAASTRGLNARSARKEDTMMATKPTAVMSLSLRSVASPAEAW